jgi:hypothetical protein
MEKRLVRCFSKRQTAAHPDVADVWFPPPFNEKLIDQIGLDPHAAGEQKLHEEIGERMFLMHYAEHLRPFDIERSAGGNGGGCRHTQPGHCHDRLLSNEVAGGEKRDCGLFYHFSK